MGSIFHLIGTIFDLLTPNFDKFIHFPNFYQNLGLKGQKLSKFVPIRWQTDPIIPNYQLYGNLDLKNTVLTKNGLFVKIKSKKKLR